jgi:hypothetical protein
MLPAGATNSRRVKKAGPGAIPDKEGGSRGVNGRGFPTGPIAMVVRLADRAIEDFRSCDSPVMPLDKAHSEGKVHDGKSLAVALSQSLSVQPWCLVRSTTVRWLAREHSPHAISLISAQISAAFSTNDRSLLLQVST